MSRRIAIAGMCAAVAVPVTMNASADPDAELIRLGKLFDIAAAELARIQRRLSAAHDEADQLSPVPAILAIQAEDEAIGIPRPQWPGVVDYRFDLDRSAVRRIDHPRAREVEAAYTQWHADHKATLEACGYSDDHPDMLDAYDALKPIEHAICTLPAQTLAGLQVKARVAFNSDVGDIADDENDCSDERAYKSVVRDLLRCKESTASQRTMSS